MKSFEEFVESRQKMDPSSLRFNEHQWKQAYTAYLSARQRVREGGGDSASSNSGGTKRRRRNESKNSRGMHNPSVLSEAGILKAKIRQQSAYADLRLIIDVLAWFAMGVVVVIALLGMLGGFNAYSVLSALIEGVLGVLVVFVAKFLIHVIIDIPDVALYLEVRERELGEGNQENTQNQ
jgi:hypothetical protein